MVGVEAGVMEVLLVVGGFDVNRGVDDSVGKMEVHVQEGEGCLGYVPGEPNSKVAVEVL